MLKEKKSAGGSDTTQTQLKHFKLRVLSLLEYFLQRNSSKPLVLTVYSYLLQAFVNSYSEKFARKKSILKVQKWICHFCRVFWRKFKSWLLGLKQKRSNLWLRFVLSGFWRLYIVKIKAWVEQLIANLQGSTILSTELCKGGTQRFHEQKLQEQKYEMKNPEVKMWNIVEDLPCISLNRNGDFD